MNMIVNGIASAQIVETAQQSAILAGLHLPSSTTLGPEQPEHEARVLASVAVAAFRTHAPVRNAMMRISDGRWDRIEEALCVILDPRARRSEFTPLAENIVDLLCATRGLNGPVVKPWFRSLLDRLLPSGIAKRLCAQAVSLYGEQMCRGDRVKGYLS
jgi:hypothetical protein